MRVAVEAAETAEQLLIEHLAQAQSSNTTGKGTGDSAKHCTRTNASRAARCTDLHADTQTGCSTGCRAGCSTAERTGHGAYCAANTLAVMAIHHALRATARTGFRHREFLTRQAS